MWALRSIAALAAIVAPLCGSPGEVIEVEGTISVGFCGMLPPIPVCVIRADGDGREYALWDVDGDGSSSFSDAIWCLNMSMIECRHRARVTGQLEWLQCDPIEGFGMNGIWPHELLIDPGPACGDVNGSGAIDISDAVQILNHLFSPEGPRLCSGVSDVNGDGSLNISDAIFLLSNLFLGGPGPRC